MKPLIRAFLVLWLACVAAIVLSIGVSPDHAISQLVSPSVIAFVLWVSAAISAIIIVVTKLMTWGMNHTVRTENGIRTYRLIPGFMIMIVLATPLVALGAVQFVVPLSASTDVVTLIFAIGFPAFSLWLLVAGLDGVFLRVVLTETELEVHRVFRAPVVARLQDLTYCEEDASEYIRLQRRDGKKIKFTSWLRGGEALHAELRDIVEKNKNA